MSVTILEKNGVTASTRPCPWAKEDQIRWVEQRVREREVIERERTEGKFEYQRQHPEWDKSGELSRVDYTAWLLHVRDRRSFQQVGNKLFARDQTPEGRKIKAYRAWARVEWEFGRGPLKRKPKPLGLAICGPYIVLKPPERRRARLGARSRRK